MLSRTAHLTMPNNLAASGAANLFDAMHSKFSDGEDRIGALQDDVLLHLMSFLPSRDAVRTCVLAKRWSTLWKSVPALRIKDDPDGYRVCDCMDETDHDGMDEFDYAPERPAQTCFVDDLLRLRDPTPLNVCDIRSVFEDLDTCRHNETFNFRRIEQWIQYALSHKVRVLRVVAASRLTTNIALISSHLKRVELRYMQFLGPLDFSGCWVLDVLQMVGCSIYASSILCPSLRHLSIKGGCFDYDTRLCISAPNLISLKLELYQGLAPLLDSMPSLQTASFESVNDKTFEGCSCDVVLEGLSRATNLKLTAAHYQVSIFRVDLKWGPTFSKLKTLLLNKWCVADDFSGLVYFLQHAPILETLLLQLDLRTSEKYHFTKTDESCSSREQSYKSRRQSSLSQHLKVVKIICSAKKDVIVDRILKILCTHGVPYDQIDIE